MELDIPLNRKVLPVLTSNKKKRAAHNHSLFFNVIKFEKVDFTYIHRKKIFIERIGYMKYESQFITILDTLQSIKTEIVTGCTQDLVLTGMIPMKTQEELKIISNMMGDIFNGLSKLGYVLIKNTIHDELVCLDLGAKQYSCPKINISSYLENNTPVNSVQEEPCIKKEEDVIRVIREMLN